MRAGRRCKPLRVFLSYLILSYLISAAPEFGDTIRWIPKFNFIVSPFLSFSKPRKLHVREEEEEEEEHKGDFFSLHDDEVGGGKNRLPNFMDAKSLAR